MWPESRRKMGAGYLQTGYYAGFFIAAALNFTVGASYGWRVMFLCGGAPVLRSFYMLSKLREPDRWTKAAGGGAPHAPLKEIFRPSYRRRTLVNAALVTISIIGLWAGAVYEPSAIVTLAKHAGHSAPEAVRLASFGTALLSIGTCLGCLAVLPFGYETRGAQLPD
jgi:MFS family permease